MLKIFLLFAAHVSSLYAAELLNKDLIAKNFNVRIIGNSDLQELAKQDMSFALYEESYVLYNDPRFISLREKVNKSATLAVTMFKYDFYAHLNKLPNDPKSLFTKQKYNKVINEVIPTEIARALFDIKGGAVTYQDNVSDVLECNNINLPIEQYTLANFNYLLFVNTLNRAINSNDVIDSKIITKTKNELLEASRLGKTKYQYHNFIDKFKKAESDIKGYFSDLKLYEYLSSIRDAKNKGINNYEYKSTYVEKHDKTVLTRNNELITQNIGYNERKQQAKDYIVQRITSQLNDLLFSKNIEIAKSLKNITMKETNILQYPLITQQSFIYTVNGKQYTVQSNVYHRDFRLKFYQNYEDKDPKAIQRIFDLREHIKFYEYHHNNMKYVCPYNIEIRCEHFQFNTNFWKDAVRKLEINKHDTEFLEKLLDESSNNIREKISMIYNNYAYDANHSIAGILGHILHITTMPYISEKYQSDLDQAIKNFNNLYKVKKNIHLGNLVSNEFNNLKLKLPDQDSAIITEKFIML